MVTNTRLMSDSAIMLQVTQPFICVPSQPFNEVGMCPRGHSQKVHITWVLTSPLDTLQALWKPCSQWLTACRNRGLHPNENEIAEGAKAVFHKVWILGRIEACGRFHRSFGPGHQPKREQGDLKEKRAWDVHKAGHHRPILSAAMNTDYESLDRGTTY
jgi:hypothetical protein